MVLFYVTWQYGNAKHHHSLNHIAIEIVLKNNKVERFLLFYAMINLTLFKDNL